MPHGRRDIYSKRLLQLLVILIIIIAINITWQRQVSNENELILNFLNVGQGDSLLIISPDHKIGLIDGGRDKNVLPELKRVLGYSKQIDFIIATHPDADHIEGFISVLDYYHVNTVIWSDVSKDSSVWQELLRKVTAAGADNFIVNSQNDFRIGCCVDVDVVWPQSGLNSKSVEDVNDLSVGVVVHYHKFSLFAAGDLGHQYEELASKEVSMPVYLSKLGHHGSKTSSDMTVLNNLRPKIAIISVGKDNSYGHPHQQVLENLQKINAEIYRTDQDGAITVTTDGEIANICKQNQLECKKYSL